MTGAPIGILFLLGAKLLVAGFFLIVEFLKEIGSDFVFTGFECGRQFIHGGNELLHLVLIGEFRCGLLGSGQTADFDGHMLGGLDAALTQFGD